MSARTIVSRARELAILGAALAAAGCGTRTELPGFAPAPRAAADAGVDAAIDSASDTAIDAAIDTATDAAIDAAPACTWSIAGAARRVSGDPIVPGDVGLMDAVPTTGGALVAWRTAGTKEQPQTIVLRLVAFDPAHDGDEHTILRAPDVLSTVDDVSLAVGHGHDGVVGTTGTTCSFHPTTLDGASNGGTSQTAGRRCAGLAATVEGFDLLLLDRSDPAVGRLALAQLDPSGVTRRADLTLFSLPNMPDYATVHRATWPDGSFTVVVEGDLWTVGTFDAQGTTQVPELGAGGTGRMVGLVPVGDALLTAKIDGETLPWGYESTLTLSPVLRNLGMTAEPSVIVSRASPPDTSWVSAATLATDPNGGALAGWIEAVRAAYVLPVDGLGHPRGAPLPLAPTLEGAQFAPVIRVVTIERRGFALFEARTDATPHRVYAAPLRCD